MTQQALTAGVPNVRPYPLKSSRPDYPASSASTFDSWSCLWVCYSERCPRARRWFSSRTIFCTSKNEFKNRFPLCHQSRVKRLQRYLLASSGKRVKLYGES
jgi:hypothetical protein